MDLNGSAGTGLLNTIVWSHRCDWADLVDCDVDGGEGRAALDLESDWTRRWSVTWRHAGTDVSSPVRDLGSLPVAGCEPVRRFSWRRGQRHRSGLQFLVSTGRHHGFESLEEARLLLCLDFAAELVDVLSQPLRLRFGTGDGTREHVPDFLVVTRSGRWLIDVRPAERVGGRDRVAFAAALLHEWRYVVVTGLKHPAVSTLDTFSAQRRPLTDPLRLVRVITDAVAERPRSFAELANMTVAPAVARAYLLHLLWHRRLGMELTMPLYDSTLIVPGAMS